MREQTHLIDTRPETDQHLVIANAPCLVIDPERDRTQIDFQLGTAHKRGRPQQIEVGSVIGLAAIRTAIEVEPHRQLLLVGKLFFSPVMFLDL